MTTFFACLLIFVIVCSMTWIRKQSRDIKRLGEENEIKNQLIDMISTEQSLELITSKLGIISDDVLDIKRGMYGDKVNGVPGLLDRQLSDEKRLNYLESYVPKIKELEPKVKVLEAHVMKSGVTRKKIAIITSVGMVVTQILNEVKNYFIK